MLAVIVVGSLAFLAICACAGAAVASSKRRSMWGGAAIGFWLGPIGILMAAALPAVPERKKILPPQYRKRPPEKRADPKEDDVAEWLDDAGLRRISP